MVRKQKVDKRKFLKASPLTIPFYTVITVFTVGTVLPDTNLFITTYGNLYFNRYVTGMLIYLGVVFCAFKDYRCSLNRRSFSVCSIF